MIVSTEVLFCAIMSEDYFSMVKYTSNKKRKKNVKIKN